MYQKSTSLIVPVTIAFVLFSAIFITAYAQETASSTTEAPTETRATTTGDRGSALQEQQQERSELIEERQENRAEAVEARETVRTERQAALTEVRQQRVLNLAANISNRMEAAIGRLFTIVERLEGRISKLNAAGVDTAAAESKLREAAQLLASARAGLSNIDTLVTNATSAPTPKTAWQNVRTVYQQTGGQIRASHQALRETVALLKTAIAQAENRPVDVATTTQTEVEAE